MAFSLQKIDAENEKKRRDNKAYFFATENFAIVGPFIYWKRQVLEDFSLFTKYICTCILPLAHEYNSKQEFFAFLEGFKL